MYLVAEPIKVLAGEGILVDLVWTFEVVFLVLLQEATVKIHQAGDGFIARILSVYNDARYMWRSDVIRGDLLSPIKTGSYVFLFMVLRLPNH